VWWFAFSDRLFGERRGEGVTGGCGKGAQGVGGVVVGSGRLGLRCGSATWLGRGDTRMGSRWLEVAGRARGGLEWGGGGTLRRGGGGNARSRCEVADFGSAGGDSVAVLCRRDPRKVRDGWLAG